MKKQNQLLTATFAAAILATVPMQATTEAAVVFPDVKADSTHFGPIHALAQVGVVSGFPDGTYRPSVAVTRGQAAKILAGVLQLNTQNVQNPQYTDVATTNEYYGAIAALTQAGIISGFEDGTYRPNATITRGHMAKMIVEGLRLQSAGGESSFTDVPATHQYKAYVDALFTYGITKGQPDGSATFGVNNMVTRGQLATFIARAKEAMQQPQPQPEPESFSLTVLHQNDLHANLNNIARTVTAVNEQRAENDNTLLLHAGDVFSGTLYFTEYRGQADVTFLNMMGVDAFTFGNHEFDLGSSSDGHQALAELIDSAQFPIVSSNVDFSKDEALADFQTRTISDNPQDGRVYDAIIKTIDGEKVGIFGLTTAETVDISSPGPVAFENYLQKAEATVKALQAQGINKIIALTHIGYDDNPAVDNDQQLAMRVDGIDVIVGGHTHTQLDEPVVIDEDEAGDEKEPTVIVQAYQYNEYLGKLDVTFDEDGIVDTVAGELLAIAEYDEDEEAKEALAVFRERIEELQQQQIGATATAAFVNPRTSNSGNTAGTSVRNSETALGNLISAGMLQKAKQFAPNVVMALQNGGGIRQPIDAGPITVGEIINVLPFGNTLATMQVTGAELKQAFEHSLKEYPKESGGFLHVAGGRITVDLEKPVGSRVQKIEYNNNGTWVMVQPSSTYTIATNAFTAKGGDGFPMFAKAYEEGRVTDLGLSDWETFAEYIAAQKTVTPTLRNYYVKPQTQPTPVPVPPVSGGGGNTTPPTPTAKALDMTIMHQNDTHARLDAVARTVTAVKEVRAAKKNTLLLHAGDVFSGTLYFTEFYGQADVEFMNMMGVDAFTLGNHEFDLGALPTKNKSLADFLKAMEFPIVSANVDASKDEHLSPLQSRTVTASPTDGRIYDAIIKSVDGEKVGIFGLTTSETVDISSPGTVAFENYIEAAKATVTKLQAQGVNKIIALTHIGYDDNANVDNDQQLAKLVAGIDVIVGGHTHTKLEMPVVVATANDADDEPTIIVQAYQHNDFLGTLDVSFDAKGVITKHSGTLIALTGTETATLPKEDEAAKAALQKYKAQVDEISQDRIGVTLANALANPRLSDPSSESVRANETILGNLITEGMLEKAQSLNPNVVLAFQNGGGIRAPIDVGDVTVGEVISVLPFGNTLAFAQVTGTELYKTFEHALKELPKESGGFLHVAGGRVTYDASKPVGSRVVSIEVLVDGEYELLPNSDATYMVATNAFTAKGGDGFTDLGNAYADGRVQDLGLSDWENFRDYLVREKDRIPTEVRGTLVPVKVVTAEELAQLGDYSGDVIIEDTAAALAQIDGLTVDGNVTIRSTTAGNVTINNATISGDLNITAVDGEVTLNNVEVAGDTIR
ncbi:MAG: 5'-nucleotidase C-terminal domain-containing protein [Caryophanon sp.]|nr:5'-nucleotidase C-terminal domain-containing protein [Caryophanon sp.]